MRKYLELMGAPIVMSISERPLLETNYSGMGGPSHRRKSRLTTPQKRERLRAKRARKARRINRK